MGGLISKFCGFLQVGLRSGLVIRALFNDTIGALLSDKEDKASKLIKHCLDLKRDFTQALIVSVIILVKKNEFMDALKELREFANDKDIYLTALEYMEAESIPIVFNSDRFNKEVEIYIAGDFNNWFHKDDNDTNNDPKNIIDKTVFKMDKIDDGWWVQELILPKGGYNFKFYAKSGKDYDWEEKNFKRRRSSTF